MKKNLKKSFAFIMAVVLILLSGSNEIQAKKTYRIKKLVLSAKQKQLVVGSTFQLKIKRVKPVRATKKVTWKTTNKAVATVNKKGIVKAKKVGKAYITAISKSNKRVKAKCKIIVVARSNNKSVNDLSDTANNGQNDMFPNPTTEPTNSPDVAPTVEPGRTPVPAVTPPGTQTQEPDITPDASPTEFPGVTPSVEPEKTPVPTVTPTDNPATDTFIVTFVDYDDSVIERKEAAKNESVKPPKEPMRKGYKFIGWDREFDNITSDIIVKAQYEEDSSPTVFVQKVSAQPGENTVEVDVFVRNNPGILGMSLTVSYDENALTLIDAVNGEAVHDVLTLTKSKVLKSGCKFVWDGQELTDNDIKDGTVLVLVFNISETAQSGEYEIVLNCDAGDIINNELVPINLSLENGIIKVSDL